MPLNRSQPFKELLNELGPATRGSLEQLHLMELDCEKRRDPNSFYMTMFLNTPPHISWQHKTDLHLGEPNLTYEKHYANIHPTWLLLHVAFAKAAYAISIKSAGRKPVKRTVYTLNVPLKCSDGKYYWYNQVTFPGAFDEAGRMVSHINQYHRLCAFDHLIPSRPTLITDDVWQNRFDGDFAAAANNSLSIILLNILTPANYRILQTYRSLARFENGSWAAPAKSEVRAQTGLSVAAINKANVRIIQAVKNKFPTIVTHDVAGFCSFLNDLCGMP